jgi:hypothetical protein
MVMNSTALIDEVSEFSIEAIKKAFIKMHQHEAANEQQVRPKVGGIHLEAVKRWIAPCEFQIGMKAIVLPCAEVGMSEDAAAQVVNGKLVLLANCITNEKQARDILMYGVIGLIAVPSYLEKYSNTKINQIYHSISGDQIEHMIKQYPEIAATDERLLVELYLADLTTLSVKPSFYERRDSWQRQLVRKLYSGLKWQSHDLHYLIHRATRCI